MRRTNALATLLARARKFLKREDGSLTESVASVILITIIASSVAMASVNDLTVISTSAATSERQNAVNAIVGEHNNTSTTWGTVASPATRPVQLASGVSEKVTTWVKTTTAGTTYYASIPRTGNVPNPTACQSSTLTTSNGNCIVASQFTARTITTLVPNALVRKDPSHVADFGTVAAAVTTGTAIPQGGQIATFTPAGSTATVNFRYLVKAQFTGAVGSGSVRIIQGNALLADIPTDTTMHDYYGTIVAKPGTAITVVSGVGAHIVSTILIYQAG